jgi:hypothetical protein
MASFCHRAMDASKLMQPLYSKKSFHPFDYAVVCRATSLSTYHNGEGRGAAIVYYLRRRTVRNSRAPAISKMPIGTRGPSAAPTFRSRPVLVKGIPVFLDIRALNAEIPSSRFHENPPMFIAANPRRNVQCVPSFFTLSIDWSRLRKCFDSAHFECR